MTASIIPFRSRRMSDHPQPVNPLPWHTKPGLPAVYDANGEVVSFTRNADFLMWAANEEWRRRQPAAQVVRL